MLLHQMLKQKNIKELSMSSPLNVKLNYNDELYYKLYNAVVWGCMRVCINVKANKQREANHGGPVISKTEYQSVT